jgi:signal transduction histidine kinase/CheY-like chemotaxis protein
MKRTSVRTYRILVVDDENIVLSFIRDALADEDCEVVTTTSGKEALERASLGSFDLILSDIRMPVMDGIELVRRIREKIPDIAVIYMTGYANLNSAKDAIKQGAIDYIMKPFELAEIRQAVRNAIQKQNASEELSSTRKLQSLTDLNDILFGAGDRKTLIISSLKFAMMHQQSVYGSVLYHDAEKDQYLHVSIMDELTQETIMEGEPLTSCLETLGKTRFREPAVVRCLEDHPIYQQQPDPRLKAYLMPDWMTEDLAMIAVPIVRTDKFHGMLILGFESDTIKLTGTALQFLAITANQLAVTLENLSLLEQTREAFSRLKELQDETIELETMAARGQTSAEIGHELNNFLGVIAGSISMLDNHLKKENYGVLDRYIRTITETIEKVRVFTANLMDARPVSSEKEVIDFDVLLREVIEYLMPQKRFRDVSINIIENPENVRFRGNVTQIQQLLHNLFNNAADATQEKGNGQIDVAVNTISETSAFTFTLKDNGIGIDTEQLKKAFVERFTTKPTGHGFGLVVCQRIIEHHGGELKVDSVVGEGTSITVRFPLAYPVEEPSEVLV